jgi:hypothetical protein
LVAEKDLMVRVNVHLKSYDYQDGGWPQRANEDIRAVGPIDVTLEYGPLVDGTNYEYSKTKKVYLYPIIPEEKRKGNPARSQLEAYEEYLLLTKDNPDLRDPVEFGRDETLVMQFDEFSANSEDFIEISQEFRDGHTTVNFLNLATPDWDPYGDNVWKFRATVDITDDLKSKNSLFYDYNEDNNVGNWSVKVGKIDETKAFKSSSLLTTQGGQKFRYGFMHYSPSPLVKEVKDIKRRKYADLVDEFHPLLTGMFPIPAKYIAEPSGGDVRFVDENQVFVTAKKIYAKYVLPKYPLNTLVHNFVLYDSPEIMIRSGADANIAIYTTAVAFIESYDRMFIIKDGAVASPSGNMKTIFKKEKLKEVVMLGEVTAKPRPKATETMSSGILQATDGGYNYYYDASSLVVVEKIKTKEDTTNPGGMPFINALHLMNALSVTYDLKEGFKNDDAYYGWWVGKFDIPTVYSSYYDHNPVSLSRVDYGYPKLGFFAGVGQDTIFDISSEDAWKIANGKKEGDVWIGKENYKKLQESFKLSDPKILLVRGTITDNVFVELAPFYAKENGMIGNITAGNYSVDFLNSSDGIINSTSFEPIWYYDENNNSLNFSFFSLELLYPENTTKIQIKNSTSILKGVLVSANAPEVNSVSAVNLGDDLINISWDVEDDDGDEMFVSLMYNCSDWDDGSLDVIVLDLNATEYSNYSLNVSDVPGGDSCSVNIWVSDMMHTTTVYSGDFSIANKAPMVSIEFPMHNGSIYYLNKTYADDSLICDGVAHWSFDEVASWNGTVGEVEDSIGDNDGTSYGDAVNTDDSSNYGLAAEFDGDGDYVSPYYMSGLDFDDSGDYTWAAWINPDSEDFPILSKGDVATRTGYAIYLEDSKLCMGDNTLPTKGCSDETIDLFTWTHIAINYSSETFTLFIDGSANGTFTITNLEDDNNNLLKIGYVSTPNFATNYADGSIDEVMIYNRALSSDEIMSLSNGSEGVWSCFGEYVEENQILFGGWASDPEFGDLGNDSVYDWSWSSDVDGVLSSNASFVMAAVNLTLGQHVITLNVSDGELSSSENVTINIVTNNTPDIEIVAIGVTPWKPTVDDNVSLSAYVWNEVDGVDSFDVAFYDGSSEIGNLTGNYSQSIGANSVSISSVIWNATDTTEGLHNIFVNVSNVSSSESNLSNNVFNYTFRIYPALNDSNKFYVDNVFGEHVAWLGDSGNIVLAGGCYNITELNATNCSSSFLANYSFGIEDSSGDIVSYIDPFGNMCIEVGSCQESEMAASCNPGSDAFIVRDSSSVNMSYMADDGSLCLKGGLHEFADAERLDN